MRGIKLEKVLAFTCPECKRMDVNVVYRTVNEVITCEHCWEEFYVEEVKL